MEGIYTPCRVTASRYCDRSGYGRAYRDGREIPGHVLAYLIAHGIDALADGMEVHHLCHVRACVEPDHLVAVPVSLNRSLQPSTCKKCGTTYPSEPDLDGRGHRRCEVCRAARSDRRRVLRRRSGAPRRSYSTSLLRPVDVVARVHAAIQELHPRAFLARVFGRDVVLVRDQWGRHFPMREVLDMLIAVVRNWDCDLAWSLHEQGYLDSDCGGPRLPTSPSIHWITGRMEPIVAYCRERGVAELLANPVEPPLSADSQAGLDEIVDRVEGLWRARSGRWVRRFTRGQRHRVAAEVRSLLEQGCTVHEILAAVEYVAADWAGFVGRDRAPSVPSTKYLVEHVTDAMNYHARRDEPDRG